MIKAIKNCIKNSDYTESEKTQMLAWIECAIDFGKNLDEVAKEKEQLKQKLDWFLTETTASKEYRPKEELEELQRENEQLKEKIKILEAKNFEKCPFRYSDIGCDYCDWKDRDLKYEVEE